MSSTRSIDVVVNDPKGLHGRVSSFLIQLGNQYEDTTLLLKPEGSLNAFPIASSIVRLLTTPVKPYSHCKFFADGPHAQELFDALLRYSMPSSTNSNIENPVFVPAADANGLAQNSAKLRAVDSTITAPHQISRQFETPQRAYLNVKTQIERLSGLRNRMSFINLLTTSATAAIDLIAQKVPRKKEDELACFIDHISRVIFLGNNAGVRHGQLANIIARSFGGNILNAPKTLTEAMIQRNRFDANSITIYFALEKARAKNVEFGITKLFGGRAEQYSAGPYAYINLSLAPTLANPSMPNIAGGLIAYSCRLGCHPGRFV